MKTQTLSEIVINEIFDNLGEHLEMLPPSEQPFVIITTLVKMLAKEREQKEYYQSLVKQKR